MPWSSFSKRHGEGRITTVSTAATVARCLSAALMGSKAATPRAAAASNSRIALQPMSLTACLTRLSIKSGMRCCIAAATKEIRPCGKKIPARGRTIKVGELSFVRVGVSRLRISMRTWGRVRRRNTASIAIQTATGIMSPGTAAGPRDGNKSLTAADGQALTVALVAMNLPQKTEEAGGVRYALAPVVRVSAERAASRNG